MSEPFPVTDHDAAGTPVLDVPRAAWNEAALYARDTLGMDYFDWLSAVDAPDGDPPGVDVVLHVADSRSAGPVTSTSTSTRAVRRVLLRARVPDDDLRLPSLTAVWPGAAWHERETFEMFGVTFDGFDDGSGDWLRPLLLPDGFEGTPLRKTFVLAARASKPWPGAKEPGESDAHAAPGRRKTLPPGVPDAVSWGPRTPQRVAGGGAEQAPDDAGAHPDDAGAHRDDDTPHPDGDGA
jgi:NADH-quinone oxidoreductase subunit C